MNEAKVAMIRYIFLDVVGFTLNRTVEAQTQIIATLNRVVREASESICAGIEASSNQGLIYLPSGDGVCICLVNQLDPFDNHLRLSLRILELLHALNKAERREACRFELRIGINENQDNLVIDINGDGGVAGAGINMAQRVMSLAGGSQIYVSQSVYEQLNQREAYHGSFREQEKMIKHGLKLICYQYVGNEKLEHLNQRLSTRPAAGSRVPLSVAVYHALLGMFEAAIEHHRDSVATTDSLVLLIGTIAQDYLEHESSNEVQRRTRRSRLPDAEVNNFAAALSCIDRSPPLVIYAARCHCIAELGLEPWGHLFHKDLLRRNRTSMPTVQRQWSWLPGHIRQHLSASAPRLMLDGEVSS